MPRPGLVTHATTGPVDDRSLLESGVALLRSAHGLPRERATPHGPVTGSG